MTTTLKDAAATFAPSRRAVTRGALWSAPAILAAGAAPALAASTGCTEGPVTVELAAGTRTVLQTDPATGAPICIQWEYTDPKTGATIRITSTAFGGTVLGRRTAVDVDQYMDTAMYYDGGLNVQHVTTGGNERQNLVIEFLRGGEPLTVSNLTLTVADIDNKGGRWYDGVSTTTPGLGVSTGQLIDGNGNRSQNAHYATGPWHNTQSSNPGQNDPAHQVVLTAGSLQTMNLTYENLTAFNGNVLAPPVGSDQNVQLQNITFQAPACA